MNLTTEEAATFSRLQSYDQLPADEYTVERGARSGHAFAVQGFSMAYDLTIGSNVDADTIEEADAVVADHPERPSPFDLEVTNGDTQPVCDDCAEAG